MIQAKKLTKAFDGFPALRGLDLTVEQGSVYGLIGRNGAGKTTLLQLLCGVYRPDSGQIAFDGAPVWENPEIKARIAVISDHPAFAPGETLCSMEKNYGRIYSRWDRETFAAVTGSLELDIRKPLRGFSKGMKKQAALALALASKPDFLLMDEPMDGLDPVVRRQIRQMLLDEVAERQATVLIASHNLQELEGICDHIGLIRSGVMAAESDLDDLKNSVCKVKAAFRGGFPDQLASRLDIVHRESLGSLETLIVRGDADGIKRCLVEADPLVLELLPLTLEEIFIYQLGGEHDEIDNRDNQVMEQA